MTALALAELPAIIALQVRGVLPELATCKAIAGRLDLAEVQRSAFATPAVLISRIRLDQGTDLAGPHRVFRVMLAAFVLTKDSLGLPRDLAATNIAQTIVQLLPDCRFGRADIGPAERISEEPIVTDAIRKAGVALSAVTWEQSVALPELAGWWHRARARSPAGRDDDD
ncbi:MAG: hypothetical protein KBF78_14525 [Fuscovulum sp.]|nr:hypothetical protein [Fuscovulum sp.]